jgi:Ca2+-binding EF-hand superfamily protein
MMTRYLLIGAAVAAIAAGGVAIAQTSPATAPTHRGHMMQTETRAGVQSRVAEHFAKVDANHDGFITKAEADAAMAQRRAKIEQRAEKRSEHFDPAAIFARLDANHDGQVTKAEAEAAHQARMAKRDARGDRMFDRADANHDGVITKAEFDAAAGRMHARMEHAGLERGGFAGRMFDSADTNKDGKLSLVEAQHAALQHFDRADLNHDGKLTPDERLQAHQQFRAQHKPS